VIGQPLATVFGDELAAAAVSLDALPDAERAVTVAHAGVMRDLLVTTASVADAAAPAPQRVILLQDVTARRAAERATLEQQRQVVILEERERMARDLHDGVGQVLGYVNAQTQATREYLRSGQVQMAEATLAQLTGVTQDAHADMRNFILGAQPGTVTPMHCGAALRQLVQQFEARYGLRMAFTLTGEATWVSPVAQTQLLYMIQEALTNVRKHAPAATASVRCAVSPDVVEVVIEDDGAGFDMQTVAGDHFGLQIMHTRMEEAGGSLAITSAPGRGTRVVARLLRPLDAPAIADDLAGLRVLLADDQPLFRDGLHNLLAARGITVVGVAANGAEAVKLATDLHPDVVIMDIHMPVLDGLAATEQIKEAAPQIQVLVLTVAERDETLVDALRRGASGYLLKNLDAQTLFTMLEQLRRGETVLTPSMATHLVRQFAGGETDAALTARQRELLSLMAQGFTYREIAAQVHLSESAVKYNAGQIIDRLHARTRAEAVRIAEKRGLI
jgi:DNA-binding NarL/FixJ family response regulator/signal transduction histidine kinase